MTAGNRTSAMFKTVFGALAVAGLLAAATPTLAAGGGGKHPRSGGDRKSTRLNSSH